MKDLIDMLEKENIGISLSSKIIHALLYADDVALLAESESDLQKMLNISYKFACKWNLKFNTSKSKVLVVGKRLDKNKKWYIGPNCIEETEVYKYLGVYVSRNMKPIYHINTYLKDNISTKLNGMVRILGKHGNFNRIEFGNALWTSVIRSTIAHGCATWWATSDAQLNMLQSLQYKAAKIILRTKMNVPISATLVELGWEPVNAFLDRQRVSYFSRFFHLPDSRLCKQVFDALYNSNVGEWPYIEYIKSLFVSVGLDHFISGSLNKNTFAKFFGYYNRMKLFEDISSKSSLSMYKTGTFSHGAQKYLVDISDFEGSRLKFLARVNCLPINGVLHRMQCHADGLCKMCHGDNVENLEHVLLHCNAYDYPRSNLFLKIIDIAQDGNIEFDFAGLPQCEQSKFLLGNSSHNFDARALE